MPVLPGTAPRSLAWLWSVVRVQGLGNLYGLSGGEASERRHLARGRLAVEQPAVQPRPQQRQQQSSHSNARGDAAAESSCDGSADWGVGRQQPAPGAPFCLRVLPAPAG